MTKPMTVDGFTIETLLDGHFEDFASAIRHHDGEEARELALNAWGAEKLRLPVNCFLLRRGDEVTLVDAGAGAGWGPAYGHMRPLLAAAGIHPDAVGQVLLTHLHGDHAFGLLSEGAAYFPKAQVIIPEADIRFFTDLEEREKLPKARQGAFDLTTRVIAAYGPRLRSLKPGPCAEGIAMVPLPGHTPGHSGYQIGSGEGSLLIWGDLLHLGQFQAADPGIGLAYDLDGELAFRTRVDCLARVVEEKLVVAGSHFEGFKTLTPDGSGYSLNPMESE